MSISSPNFPLARKFICSNTLNRKNFSIPVLKLNLLSFKIVILKFSNLHHLKFVPMKFGFQDYMIFSMFNCLYAMPDMAFKYIQNLFFIIKKIKTTLETFALCIISEFWLKTESNIDLNLTENARIEEMIEFKTTTNEHENAFLNRSRSGIHEKRKYEDLSRMRCNATEEAKIKCPAWLITAKENNVGWLSRKRAVFSALKLKIVSSL